MNWGKEKEPDEEEDEEEDEDEEVFGRGRSKKMSKEKIRDLTKKDEKRRKSPWKLNFELCVLIEKTEAKANLLQ